MKARRSRPDELVVGLVSVSDRASSGMYQDQGLPGLYAWLDRALASPWQRHERLVPDERDVIEATLVELVDSVGCELVLTTGGTGPARRDVTPEATLAVATREMPGFAEQMRRISLHFVPTAILSRQVAVLRETPDHAALIINLPEQPKAIAETLEGLKDAEGRSIVGGIFAAVPYCIGLIGGPRIETNEPVVKPFRPKSARKSPEPADGEQVRDTGADVVGLDWRVDIDVARKRLGKKVAVQGNLDPCSLFLPERQLGARVREVLRANAGQPGHVFNLGHGILPGTPTEAVRAVVDHVHATTTRG